MHPPELLDPEKPYVAVGPPKLYRHARARQPAMSMVQGMSPEAVTVMQKNLDGGWTDYNGTVPRLADVLRAAGKRRQVDVSWAEKDRIVGDPGSRGPRWFDGLPDRARSRRRP